MFNTGLFVVEVQKRPCLWNVKDSSHNDKQMKLQAWEQIANVFNGSKDSYSPNNKNITIDTLQRKWKHLRDYYIREKKRTSQAGSGMENNASGGNSAARKRKSPLLDMLQFLDANRGTGIVQVTIERSTEEENFYSENNEEEDKSISEYTLAITHPNKIQRIEVQQSNPLTEDKEDSSDKLFLASLLPVIKNMNTKEKLKLQAQLMNPTSSVEYPLYCTDEEEISRTSEIRKRQKASRKSEEIEVINKETKSTEAIPKRDEFNIYGEYVANKLRNIKNTHARHTAEFHINGILYKAEMGEYDVISRDMSNSARSANSRESSNARIIESLMYHDDDPEDIIATVIKTEVLD